MDLMNQPLTGQLGNRLIELLESTNYHTFNVVVAFAKNSGVLRIKDAVARFRDRGGVVNAYVGVDLGGTSYEALTALLHCTDSLNVIHSERGQTFHAKIYQFLGKEEDLIVVGSHNLTAGGLWTNFESSVIIPRKSGNSTADNIFKSMDKYIDEILSLKDSVRRIDGKDDLDKLFQNGYIFKEVAEQVRLAKAATQNRTKERLFGNGAPAKLPRVDRPGKDEKPPVVHVDPAVPAASTLNYADQTIWFETKSMTGGSRNILDLSKRSLLERGDTRGTTFDLGDQKFMRGGVEFFGLDPAATELKKDITLNFEGIDYAGNEILYPFGEHANGTWRLQIKGVASSGRKITDAFKAKGEDFLLVRKIITFTKIQDDYYYLSVFPESDLESFKAASHILARNGATKKAKQLGLILKSLESP